MIDNGPLWPRQVASYESGNKLPHSKKYENDPMAKAAPGKYAANLELYEKLDRTR